MLLTCVKCCWPVWSAVDLCEVLLTCVKCCWPVWSAVDLCEVLLTCVKCCWPVWSAVDLCEVLLTCVKCCWPVCNAAACVVAALCADALVHVGSDRRTEDNRDLLYYWHLVSGHKHAQHSSVEQSCKLKLNTCTNLSVFVQVYPTGVLFAWNDLIQITVEQKLISEHRLS